ncbi:MFS transporter [uncultured Sphaerochaeta sp.]|uniref:MFS transporter n=1 Tax=uncultured Sphaerochaeta sp. TaxID=886478 RepID=UPI002A0A3DFC|nr:MFS transporter [uncultured Sphaerochaeta sp.]
MNLKTLIHRDLQAFLMLWITQSCSQLGSSMTSFALVLYLYEKSGSALSTALLSVCSYAPYILLSMFAGALSDSWNKKRTMLVCDSLAAISTIVVFVLLQTNQLQIWHLYGLNVINGMMNTVQQPASEVAVSLITPRRFYQKVSGLKSFSNALNTMLTPIIATALYAFAGMQAIILVDVSTFLFAFIILWSFIEIPQQDAVSKAEKESVLRATGEGIRYLKQNRGILNLILFLSAINLTASAYNAALPAMLLSRAGGGATALGWVTMVTGFATLVGSIVASAIRAPKSRVKVIYWSLLFSMSAENFMLAFGKSIPVWCIGAILGWIAIPLMGTNLGAILRLHIPIEMQGRVYATRNTLQFCTIPVGYLLGGFLVDKVFEPFVSEHATNNLLIFLFGSGKGSGAAFLFAVMGVIGVATCLVFGKNRAIWGLEQKEPMDEKY